MLKERLFEETNKLKWNFASLMFDVQMDLEKRLSVQQVIDILVFYDKNLAGVLAECTTMSVVFRKVRDFVSFFDYDLLEYLINKFCSDSIKKELELYNDHFQEFSKRRVTQCPSNAFDEGDGSECESSEEVVVIYADKNIEELTLDELKKFKRRINKILGGKLVKVKRVEGGSIRITFRIFRDKNFNISEKQCQALHREGVTSIMYGDHCSFDMRPTAPTPGIAKLTYIPHFGKHP